MNAVEGTQFGPYQIKEIIGEGGMASVYRAYDEENARHVAIKILSPYVAQEPQFRSRFRREIEVLKELHHEHVMPILDWGEVDEYAYIVMPLMTEGTLRERLLAGPLPLTAAADLLHQIASALEFTHTQGVIHRDIKPSNILIDSNGKALLTDFGFARVLDTSQSLTGSALIGTPAYMSPEQCRGEQAGPLSDQYSMGIILYQMVTGSLPYEADTPLGVVILHATEPLPPPGDIKPDLPMRVEAVILKALEKEPERRYPTMTALDEAFQAAVLASSTSFGELLKSIRLDRPTQVFEGIGLRFRQIARRKRLRHRLRWIGALFLAITLIGVIWWAWRGNLFNGGMDPLLGQEGTMSAELLATIDALSTGNAPQSGTQLAPGDLATAVAGTLEALIAKDTGGLSGASSGLDVATSDTLPALASQTGQADPSQPATLPTQGFTVTDTPQPTKQSTGYVTFTPTPVPTKLTPSPVNTQVPPTQPPPTEEPSVDTPIPPDKCKPPDHPVFGCTPTPGG